MNHTYQPRVNDYVIWNDLKGWVYFVCDEYITIEIKTKPKPDKLSMHKFDHVCVLCFTHDFNQLTYIATRPTIHHGLEESTNRFNNGGSIDDSIDQSNASDITSTAGNAQPIG